MKHCRLKAWSTLAFTAAPWLLAIPAAQADDSVRVSARVISVVGSARYFDRNRANWSDLRPGAEFGADAVLQTNLKDSTADLALVGSDAGPQGRVRMFSDCILKVLQLNSKKSGSAQLRHIGLDVTAGRIRVSLDGVSQYDSDFSGARTMRMEVRPHDANPQETVFVFDAAGTLTVLKGAVKASIGAGQQKLVRLGEQLRSDANEVRRVPPDAPELKLAP
jgi:hypothetical protein